MKKIILIGLFGISTALSSPLFAYKILWTKESVTPGAEGHIIRHINSTPINKIALQATVTKK